MYCKLAAVLFMMWPCK